MKNKKNDTNSATKKNKKIDLSFIKFFSIIVIPIIIIVLLASYIFVKQGGDLKTGEQKKEIKEEFFNDVENKYNSDAKLVDDRLPSNAPILFIASPSSDGLSNYITILCLYNDGLNITQCLGISSLDTFNEELTQSDAFIKLLMNNYYLTRDTEIKNLVTTDKNPSDIRNAYLKSYEIKDKTMTSTIDLTGKASSTFYLYICNYDESEKEKRDINIEFEELLKSIDLEDYVSYDDIKYCGNSILLMASSTTATNEINDTVGKEILEWYFNMKVEEYSEILGKDMLNNLN